MKKIMIALFILGMLLMLVDVDNMKIFFATKIIGLLFIVPLWISTLKKGV